MYNMINVQDIGYKNIQKEEKKKKKKKKKKNSSTIPIIQKTQTQLNIKLKKLLNSKMY